MITINQQELEGLMNYCQQQPAGIINPVIAFFNQKIEAYNKSQKIENSPSPEHISNMEVIHSSENGTPKPVKAPNSRKATNNA
jgi:hypothetical protein